MPKYRVTCHRYVIIQYMTHVIDFTKHRLASGPAETVTMPLYSTFILPVDGSEWSCLLLFEDFSKETLQFQETTMFFYGYVSITQLPSIFQPFPKQGKSSIGPLNTAAESGLGRMHFHMFVSMEQISIC